MDKKKGFIKIARSIEDNWVYEDPQRLGRWVILILKANWEDEVHTFRGKQVTIRKGQIYASYRQIARWFKCDYHTVRRIIYNFIEHELLQTETINDMTLITITNYNKYQPKKFDLKHDQSAPQSAPQSETFTAKGGTQIGVPEKSCKQDEKAPHLKEYKEKTENRLTPIKERKEAAADEDFDVNNFIKFFNGWIFFGREKFGCKIPPIRALTPTRLEAVNKLRAQGAEGKIWIELMQHIIRQPFLNGRGKKHFVATFDWLIQPEHFWRTLEGVYI